MDFCKEILEDSDLKIHIETGNIYYKNIDSNESIFEFFKNQQNFSKSNIKFDFVYDRNFDNYFRWILNGFDSYKKSKLDVWSYKNIKFLFYCLNYLLNQFGRNIKLGKQSGVTDDYIAAEEIQNQNWQYFIEQVLEVCKDKEIGRTIRKSQDFLLDTVENVTLAKKSYETFYNIFARNFYSAMEKRSVDEYEIIKEDFYRETFWANDVATQLDCWIAFYFQHGRLPGSQKVIATPQVKTPPFLKSSIPISPIHLYKKFTGTNAKALVSFQGLAALNIHLRRNKFTSQNAMYEYLKNLTFQALSQKNDKVFMSFEDSGLLVNDLLESIIKKENKQIEKS